MITPTLVRRGPTNPPPQTVAPLAGAARLASQPSAAAWPPSSTRTAAPAPRHARTMAASSSPARPARRRSAAPRAKRRSSICAGSCATTRCSSATRRPSKPRYAVAVIVEHGGGGGATAAPLARDILETSWRAIRCANRPGPAFAVDRRATRRRPPADMQGGLSHGASARSSQACAALARREAVAGALAGAAADRADRLGRRVGAVFRRRRLVRAVGRAACAARRPRARAC